MPHQASGYGLRASAAYDRACNIGPESGGCTDEGLMYLYGDGVPQNLDKGGGMLVDACKAGDGRGCHVLANFLLNFASSNPNAVGMAVQLLNMSCDTGYEASCADLGLLLLRVGESQRGIEMLKASCHRGGGEACVDEGLLYHRGVLVGKSDTKAVEKFKRACDDGTLRACGYVGGAMLYGWGGMTKNIDAAVPLLKQGCMDAEDVWSCNELGHVLLASNDTKGAGQAFRISCSQYDIEGCRKVCKDQKDPAACGFVQKWVAQMLAQREREKAAQASQEEGHEEGHH
jgi:TPR repeat protein